MLQLVECALLTKSVSGDCYCMQFKQDKKSIDLALETNKKKKGKKKKKKKTRKKRNRKKEKRKKVKKKNRKIEKKF